jgi:hypothetical protein
MKYVLIFILTFILLSCETATTARKPVSPEQLYGQWRNEYMKLEMPTYRNGDSLKVLEVNLRNWERVMHIQPIRTYFWYNGTYNSAHYDLNDSLIYNPAGNWLLRNDTLIMTDTFPKRGLQYRYKVSMNGVIAEFSGVEDLDGDGKADDHYYGTQRKYVDQNNNLQLKKAK